MIDLAKQELPEYVDLALTPLELQLLEQVLRATPISGTADNLAQVLPLVQGVRAKVQVALQRLTAPVLEEAEEV